MEKEISVKVAGSTYDALQGVIKAINGFKEAKKNGGNIVAELVAIEAALAPIAGEIGEIKNESIENDLKALAILGPDLIAALKA